MKKWIALVIGLALLVVGMGVAACASGDAVKTGATLTPEQQAAVDMAKTKLAARLSVESAKISLVSAEAVDWPDTSMGVPETGKVYNPAITHGYKIILSANGSQYEYHTGTIGNATSIVAK
ncbi:MAG: hypothetical protein Q7T05_07260 [Dehalococcoidia bacterium]|nr:hypothetical protein [Dehalococcoidia bacterium]